MITIIRDTQHKDRVALVFDTMIMVWEADTWDISRDNKTYRLVWLRVAKSDPERFKTEAVIP